MAVRIPIRITRGEKVVEVSALLNSGYEAITGLTINANIYAYLNHRYTRKSQLTPCSIDDEVVQVLHVRVL